jgi:translation initiation factor 4E
MFWFRQQQRKIVSYEGGIKRVAAFSSSKSLWALTPTTDYLFFHAAVQRPV